MIFQAETQSNFFSIELGPRIPSPFPRVVHVTVLEPVSQRLWVIGGEDDSPDGFTSDVLKMSINTLPLKTLALYHIARNIKASDPRLSSNNYPKRLINEIEEHRYIIEDNDEDATASHLISQTSSDVAEGPPIIEDSDEEVFAHLHLYNA